MRRAPEAERRRVCAHCGAVFFDKPSRTRTYCSITCRADALRTQPRDDPRPCATCGTVYKPSRHYGKGRYCTKRCEWVARGGAAFNARIARESAEKRGALQRGSGEGRSYRKLNGRHEHRVVAERTLGRRLRRGEVVHHIDGNRRNNAPENLRVMTQREHMLEHGIGIPGVAPTWLHSAKGPKHGV